MQPSLPPLSVAAHVRGLASPNTAPYDPAEAESERAAERAVEARKAARAAALSAGGAVAAGAAGKRLLQLGTEHCGCGEC